MNIILIILVFCIIVTFHEFGHFVVAKLNGISVTEFSVGMGPALFSIKKKETKYSVRLLPIGGYCMMTGENGEVDETDENAFANKSVWARIATIFAGPLFNFILAFVFGIILINYTGSDPCILSYVGENSGAAEAGIEVGDRICEIEGKKIYNYRELLLYIQMNDLSQGDVTFLVEKQSGELKTITVTPKINENGEYKLGVAAGYVKVNGIGSLIKYSALECRYWVKATVSSLKLIVTGKVKGNDVMGPVGVGGAMNDIIEEVKAESNSKKEAAVNIILNMLNWCILLSVNLGIMNLLPIPALDGGRLLFLFVELIRRKKVSPEKEAIVTVIGFVLLIFLMILVFFNDIKNIIIK